MRIVLAIVVVVGCKDGKDPAAKVRMQSSTEVPAMFAELAVREEQYRVDSGSYLAAPICTTDLTGCPGWRELHVKPPMKLACEYKIVTGTGPNVTGLEGFKFQPPIGNWYFAIAGCRGEVARRFFTSSVDPAIQQNHE